MQIWLCLQPGRPLRVGADYLVMSEPDTCTVLQDMSRNMLGKERGRGRRRRLVYVLPSSHTNRLISVMESMDNGKPIRESRDLDIPLVARHFYHHAGTGVHL